MVGEVFDDDRRVGEGMKSEVDSCGVEAKEKQGKCGNELLAELNDVKECVV